jgi:hypothetical protein
MDKIGDSYKNEGNLLYFCGTMPKTTKNLNNNSKMACC